LEPSLSNGLCAIKQVPHSGYFRNECSTRRTSTPFPLTR